MGRPKKKQTREERLEKKRAAERLRYQRLKSDPIRYEKQKEKDRRNYIKKKEQGTIKSIADVTPKEQKVIRELWAEKSRKRRARLALLNSSALALPGKDHNQTARPQVQKRIDVARKRPKKQGTNRVRLILKQQREIAKLRKEIGAYKKRLYCLNKSNEKDELTSRNKTPKI